MVEVVRETRSHAITGHGEITTLLARFGEGDPDAFDRLVPLVYGELRVLALHHRRLWGLDPEAPGATSLVHEAYVKLANLDRVDWESRAQFYAIASRVIRSVLIDNARWHRRRKRGGDRRRVPLETVRSFTEERSAELIALDGALERLEAEEERLARIVECRFFGGLTVNETAEALDVSESTVKRGWNLARTWLYRELVETPEASTG